MRLAHAAYEPAGADSFHAVLALHGWGANALDLLGLAPYLHGFMMLCPQGPIDVSDGPADAHGWFPRVPGLIPDAGAIDAAVTAVIRFIDETTARYSLERRKIALLGFSQGGVIGYGLALRYPARFAAFTAISTWLPDSLFGLIGNNPALAKLPILIQHGRSDELIEVGRARTAVERLRAAGLNPALMEYDCGHQITGQGLSDIVQFFTRHAGRGGSPPE